jgi:hypothetical protein
MDMRAGGRAGDGPPRRDEGNPLGPQMLHQRSPLGAIGVDGQIERIAMIEAHAVMQRRLPEGADWVSVR